MNCLKHPSVTFSWDLFTAANRSSDLSTDAREAFGFKKEIS